MEAAKEFAEYIHKIKFSDLSGEVVDRSKRFILDTLGVALAGSSAPGSREVVDQVKHWAGKEETTLWIFGGRLPAPLAALANSTMAHARDFDDTHDAGVVHAHVCALPAAVAAAEARGNRSGKELILAVVLGVEIACRLGVGIGQGSDFEKIPPGFVRTSVCGAFGAAAAAAKVLALNSDTILNALGIAYSQASGNRQVVADLSLTKRLQPAFASQAGVLSAFLARRGITGCREVFEGKYGFFNLYWNGGYSREALFRSLGEQFETNQLSFKPYPCCRYTHGSIEATLKIVFSNDLLPSEVSEVLIHVPTLKFFDLVSRPFEIRGDPQVDAQFSIPYTTAVAILRRRVFLDDFEEEAIRDPQVKDLSQKVKVLQDLEPESRASLGPVVVEIHTKDGRIFREEVKKFKGSPERPLSMGECQEKFLECSKFSPRPFRREKLERLLGVVEELDKVEDVGEIFQTLMVGE